MKKNLIILITKIIGILTLLCLAITSYLNHQIMINSLTQAYAWCAANWIYFLLSCAALTLIGFTLYRLRYDNRGKNVITNEEVDFEYKYKTLIKIIGRILMAIGLTGIFMSICFFLSSFWEISIVTILIVIGAMVIFFITIITLDNYISRNWGPNTELIGNIIGIVLVLSLSFSMDYTVFEGMPIITVFILSVLLIYFAINEMIRLSRIYAKEKKNRILLLDLTALSLPKILSRYINDKPTDDPKKIFFEVIEKKIQESKGCLSFSDLDKLCKRIAIPKIVDTLGYEFLKLISDLCLSNNASMLIFITDTRTKASEVEKIINKNLPLLFNHSRQKEQIITDYLNKEFIDNWIKKAIFSNIKKEFKIDTLINVLRILAFAYSKGWEEKHLKNIVEKIQLFFDFSIYCQPEIRENKEAILLANNLLSIFRELADIGIDLNITADAEKILENAKKSI